jgi:hypothetical protein
MSETNLGTITGNSINGKINVLGKLDTYADSAFKRGPIYYGLGNSRVWIVDEWGNGGWNGYSSLTISIEDVNLAITNGYHGGGTFDFTYNPSAYVYNTNTTPQMGTFTGSKITDGSLRVYNCVISLGHTIYYAQDKSNKIIMVNQDGDTKVLSYNYTSIATDTLIMKVWRSLSKSPDTVIYTPLSTYIPPTVLGTITGKRVLGYINILGTFTNPAYTGPLFYGCDGEYLFVVDRGTNGMYIQYQLSTISIDNVVLAMNRVFTSVHHGGNLGFAEAIYNPPEYIYNTRMTPHIGTFTGAVFTNGLLKVYNSVKILSDTIYYAHDKDNSKLIMVNQNNILKILAYPYFSTATDNLIKVGAWGTYGSISDIATFILLPPPPSIPPSIPPPIPPYIPPSIPPSIPPPIPPSIPPSITTPSSTNNITMYVIIGVVSLLIVSVGIYFIFFNKVAAVAVAAAKTPVAAAKTSAKKGGYQYSLFDIGD